MLGAFMVMIGRLGAGGVDDHFALDCVRAKKFGRDHVNAFARVVFGVEHRLLCPIDDAHLRRCGFHLRIEARGVGHFGEE